MIIWIILGLLISNYIIGYLIQNNKSRVLTYYEFPGHDTIVMFHAAIGEEFMFRIAPYLLFPDFWTIRFVISTILFSSLHSIPFFMKSSNIKLYYTLLIVGSTFIMGCSLSVLESYLHSQKVKIKKCLF